MRWLDLNLQHAQRKNEHLSLAEKYYSQAHWFHPFNQVRLIPNALPETATTDVQTNVQVAGLDFQWPFYFEAMTGGSQQATKVNAAFARVASQTGIAMATGSMSITNKLPQFNESFQVVRQLNPNGVIIANLGANASIDQARRAVQLINADALEIHLNVAQEIVMPEGDRDFHCLDNLQKLIANLQLPIIVKEVGFGMSRETIKQLADLGAHTVNISGRGGTNFAMIEDHRNYPAQFADLYDWGLTTPESLLEANSLHKRPTIIASGGITSPLDVIKAGVLGAQAVGVAGFFLHEYYQHGEEGLLTTVQHWQTEIVRLLTILGCQHFSDLQHVQYVLSTELANYVQQRHL